MADDNTKSEGSRSEPPAAPLTVVKRTGSMPLQRQFNTAPKAKSDQGLTPAFVWRVFSSWWKIVIPAGLLLAFVAGVAVWLLHEPQFVSSALVKIESETPFIAFDKANFNREPEAYVQTQIELMRGPSVLSKLLDRPDVRSIEEIKAERDKLKYLQKKVSVKQVGKSELYEVSFTSASRDDAETIVNLLVSEYLAFQTRQDQERTDTVVAVLEIEQGKRGEDVKQLRDEYVELAKNVTGRDPFGQGVITDVTAFSPAGSLFQSLTETEVSLEVVKAERQTLRNASMVAEDRAIASGVLELEIASRPDIRRLEERIAALRDRLAQIKSRPRTKIGDAWEEDPAYVENQALLTATEEQLRELKVTAREELLETHRSAYKVEQQQMLVEKEKEFDALVKRREMLKERLDQQMAKLKQGGAQSAQLELLKAQLEREQSVFEMIAQRKLALQTEVKAPARVSLVYKARTPVAPIEAIPFKLLGIACLAGLLCPLALAVGHEAMLRRIRNPDQLLHEAELPILGEIAKFPVRKVTAQTRALPLSKQREMFIFAESIDGLRTNLMLTGNLGRPGDARVIAVCSASSGEGKTSVATSLAMSIAEASKYPTLIIDADLRDPDVAATLATKSTPGLSELLTGHAVIGDSIHRVGDTHAYVLPAGEQRVNPHHLLTGDRITTLLGSLRKRFATIIIDTPPVLSASESLVYAKAADLTLYCSLADVSRSAQVRLATERLRSTGALLAGAVLSGVPLTRYVYHYGSYPPGYQEQS